MVGSHDFDGINKWNVYTPFKGEWKPSMDKNFDYSQLISDCIFSHEEVANMLLTGSHGLTAEVFG